MVETVEPVNPIFPPPTRAIIMRGVFHFTLLVTLLEAKSAVSQPSRILSACFIASLLIATMSVPSRADRVYQLIDIPSNQNGHSLNGTITTTDDAPNDSVLNVAEILGWQWSISGANSFSATSMDFLIDATTTFGVRISPDAISLPIGSRVPSSALTLSRQFAGGRGPYIHELSWRVNDGNPTSALSSARRQDGDAGQSFWFGPATFPTSSGWVVAVAVPEPATGLLLVACVIPGALWRRR